MTKICIKPSDHPAAQAAAAALKRRHKSVALDDADVIVAVGGDGHMLEVMHETIESGKPIFGLNKGTVGFLMNAYGDKDLLHRIETAGEERLHPLRMSAVDAEGTIHQALAINEVSLLRETRQAARLRISIDGLVRLEELICDGALVATSAGSTAYNLSAHGPILPLGSDVLALTPISAFRPRRWRGAILKHTAVVRFDILESRKRPVSAVADNLEVRDVRQVEVKEDRGVTIRLLFDKAHALDERILREQFAG